MWSEQTEAMIAELEKPSIVCADDVCSGVGQFLATAGCLEEQAARWQRMLRLAEVAEVDPNVRGAFSAADQKIGALRRQASELDRLLRDVVATSRDLRDVATRLRTHVERVTAHNPEPTTAAGT